MADSTRDTSFVLDQHLHESLYSRRVLVLGDALDQDNSTRLCMALLALSTDNPTADITVVINSPGGSVPGMLAIRDTMRAIPNDVVTVNLGMAYSAGQFLLSAGTSGKRFSMPHGKVLLHQGSGGIGGAAPDISIQADDITHTRDTVLGCIAQDTGRPIDQVFSDSLRDRWFTAEEALDYGFIDGIITSLSDVLSTPRPSFGIEVHS